MFRKIKWKTESFRYKIHKHTHNIKFQLLRYIYRKVEKTNHFNFINF